MIDKGQSNRRIKFIMLSLCLMLAAMVSGCEKNGKDIHENSGMQFSNVDELDGHVIAMLEGTVYDTDIQDRFPNAEIQYYPAYADCIVAVKSGKADSYILEEALVNCQIKESGGLTYFPEQLSEQEYAFMLNKNSYLLQQEVNKALKELAQEGVLDELEREWIEGEGVRAVDRNPDADTSKGTLQVITCNDVEPFCYVENGEVAGYEIELFVKVAERLGYAVEFNLAEFSAFMPAIKEGKMDVAIGCISATPERAEVVNFSEPEYKSSVVAVVTNSSKDENGFLDDIKSSFNRTFVKENRWKLLRDGLIVTVQISVISMIFGTLLGFAFSFPLRSKNVAIRQLSNAISIFLDGMPLVIILMVLYYIVFSGIDISAVWVGIIGFILDFANTVAGLLNTGISAVDKGQLEAASSMGYNKLQIFWKITFPQAAKQMFSQYEGAVVGLVKGTAIVGYITVEDLTKAGDIIRSRTYEAFFPLIVTAVLYFLIAYLFIAVLKRVDIKLDPKRRPRRVKGVYINDKN